MKLPVLGLCGNADTQEIAFVMSRNKFRIAMNEAEDNAEGRFFFLLNLYIRGFAYEAV